MKYQQFSKSYWDSFAKKNRRFMVYYGTDVIDLTDYLNQHPGGQRAILPYERKDIKDILFSVYPHPQSAVKTILRFKYGELEKPTVSVSSNRPGGISPHSINQKGKKQKKVKSNKTVKFLISEDEDKPPQRSRKETKKKRGTSKGQKSQTQPPLPHSPLKDQSIKNSTIDQSQIDIDDGKPDLKVPFIEIRLGIKRMKPPAIDQNTI